MNDSARAASFSTNPSKTLLCRCPNPATSYRLQEVLSVLLVRALGLASAQAVLVPEAPAQVSALASLPNPSMI